MLTVSAGSVLAAEAEGGGGTPQSQSEASGQSIVSYTTDEDYVPQTDPKYMRARGPGYNALTAQGQAIYDEYVTFLAGLKTGDTSKLVHNGTKIEENYSPDLSVADGNAKAKELTDTYMADRKAAFTALMTERYDILYWVAKGTVPTTKVSVSTIKSGPVDGDRNLTAVSSIEISVTTYFTASEKYYSSKITETIKTQSGDQVYDIYTLKLSDGNNNERLAEAKKVAQSVVDDAKGKSELEQLKYFHDWIKDKTTYDTTAAASGNPAEDIDPWQMINVFEGKAVVCEGYSKAFNYLCDLAGIECTLVTGQLTYTGDGAQTGGVADKESGKVAAGHMWNEVKLDGNWYIVDVTNDDGNGFGAPDKLFLIGAKNENAKYFVSDGSGHTLADADHYEAPQEGIITIDAVTNGTIKVVKKSDGTEVKDGDKVAAGTVLTVTRIPAAGYELNTDKFKATEDITVTGDTAITAEFAKFCTVTITNKTSAGGKITVKNGSDEVTTDTVKVAENTTLTVVPVANDGYKLTSEKTSVNVGGNTKLTIDGAAYFEKVSPPSDDVLDSGYTVKISKSGSGDVKASYKYNGAYFDVKDSGNIPAGAQMKVVATPANGYTLSSIKANGVAVSNDKPFTPKADANRVISVVVAFEKSGGNNNGNGGGDFNPSGNGGGSGSGGSGGGGGGGSSSSGKSSAQSALTGKINSILAGQLGGGSTVSGGIGGGSTTGSTQPVTAAQATQAAQAAVKAAQAIGGKTAAVRFANVSALTPAAIQAVYNAAVKAGMTPTIYADTVVGGQVVGRVYYTPAAQVPTANVNVSMTVGNKAIQQHFEKYFKNQKFAVVTMGQKGAFGSVVQVAVKIDLSGMDLSSLAIYSYDAAANAYTLVENTGAFVDANGYLHFNTPVGNNIVITDKAL